MSKQDFRRIRGVTDQQTAHTFGVQHQSLLWVYRRITGWRAWAWLVWAVFVTGTLLVIGYQTDVWGLLNRLVTTLVLLWVWN